MQSYDVVGDIHGHAAKLERLLRLMGYVPRGRSYRAPQGRKAVFLGDLIDRGPAQVRVLEVVRSMVEQGEALCIMGNHEFNAIGYATTDPLNPVEALRPNRGDSVKCAKNRAQHAEFLAQLGEGSMAHKSATEWFRTLPVWLDLGGIRVVHGCWDDAAVATLRAGGWGPGKPLTDDLLYEVGRITTPEDEGPMVQARKLLTCGLEVDLPPGRFIVSKDGHQFDNVRIANWRYGATELAQVALVPAGQEKQLQGMGWPAKLVLTKVEGAPVFLGHHWFTGEPKIESEKLACLDWSAAKDGPLVGYRWDGEAELNDAKLIGSH
jgi:hypothetical protein